MEKEPLITSGRLPYTLTNDYLFHIVFQRNQKILRGLLQSLLNLKDEEITDIRLENPITPGARLDDKSITLDLLITLNGNQKINIEMQVVNGKDWPERSLTYLCKSFDNLKTGMDYKDVMPTIHIGILDFTLFPKYPEFYAHYAMANIINHNIYSDKLLVNVLDLTQTDMATDNDIACGLQHWARLFKAATWEELKTLTADYKDLDNIVDIVRDALADKNIRMQCEARERYERDRTSLFNSGKREGHVEGLVEGHAAGLSEGPKIAIEMLQQQGKCKKDIINELTIKYQLKKELVIETVNLYWQEIVEQD